MKSPQVAKKDNQAAYSTRYCVWNRLKKAGSSSPWFSILRSKENLKDLVRSGMQRGRCRQGAAPGKKPGAMHQINVEVRTRKYCEKT